MVEVMNFGSAAADLRLAPDAESDDGRFDLMRALAENLAARTARLR